MQLLKVEIHQKKKIKFKKMKIRLSIVLFLGILLAGNAQTYMYIQTAEITPESPISTDENVFLHLTGDFSDSGAEVDDFSFSLDGTTVNFVINASSPGGLAVLTPFDLTYDLGTFEVGEYTVELSGTGIGVAVEGPISFSVEDAGTGSVPNSLAELAIQMYPNPTVDVLTINVENWQNNAQIEILSVESKIILSQSIISKTTTLDLSDLPNGLYMARVSDVNGMAVRTERIVIAH